MREEEKGFQRVIVRRKRTLSDNVEAVQGPTDNPKSTCSSIALITHSLNKSIMQANIINTNNEAENKTQKVKRH